MLAVAIAVAVALLVFLVEPKDSESYSPVVLVPAVEDAALGLRDLLYLEPGYPGLIGSSSVPGFFDSITTALRMMGRNCGSAWVHNSPICMQTATWSGTAEDANVGPTISRIFSLL